jgi:uncharacterized protein
MNPKHQISIWIGAIAIALMVPSALPRSDWMVSKLGKSWRYVHLLSVPVFILASVHTIAIGSNYLVAVDWTLQNWILTILCGVITVGTLLIRAWKFRK